MLLKYINRHIKINKRQLILYLTKNIKIELKIQLNLKKKIIYKLRIISLTIIFILIVKFLNVKLYSLSEKKINLKMYYK